MEIENSSAIDKTSTVPFKFQGDFFYILTSVISTTASPLK